MEVAEIKKHLKAAFWDYNYDEEDLYNVLYLNGQSPYLSKERIYQRLLETYSWYKLLSFLSLPQLEEALSENIINQLRAEALRKRYTHVARILREKIVSATE